MINPLASPNFPFLMSQPCFSDKFSVRAGIARMQLEAASEQILTQAGRPHLRGGETSRKNYAPICPDPATIAPEAIIFVKIMGEDFGLLGV
jgi:hypothetical protein